MNAAMRKRSLTILPLAMLLLGAPVDAAPSSSPSPAAHAPKATARPTPPSTEVTTESGLVYRDLVIGKGPSPREGQKITIHYVGRLAGGGRVFDSSYRVKRPLTFTLGDHEVIRGMEEGVSTMRVGGRRVLVVPPRLGYRDEIVGTIPPDSTLEFEVLLLEVK